ncbi:uncharacterized protein MONBRDRAFT_13840 [Monosiga brevicollis MX1]|uniref:Cfap43 N-terminal domain-containing protein n=1 Tax=Monosiga brevicollis TaxID=81824 RepID=A9UP99_MONBE|nr:uncharacterized protein MONBRDRAFT_13840 [Monosiga brevicollis MX1]EDQ92382.1 predicted protein [Monosiga brevicollis MX1]|eukprot:XP_001742144.1 hypothetical protein [Monosiga brevicollis MX1]
MSPPLIEPKYAFGLRAAVVDNACYLDEQNVVYPAGGSIVVYNADQKSQRFIHSTEGRDGFSAMAVSPNRRYIAVAERGETASVTIYDLHSLKKRKFLSLEEPNCTEVVCLVFSPDSKYLVTVGGGPDWMMQYWAWERSHGLMATVKCSLDPAVPVYRASFNPQDNTQLCVTGKNILKMYRYTEGTFKQLAFPKVEGQNYLHQVWLSRDAIVCGTEAGKLLVYAGNELVSEVTLPERITALASLTTGFVCGTATGLIAVYERHEAHQYTKVRELTLGEEESAAMVHGVHHIAISPAEERLVATTSRAQLYTVALTDVDSDVLRGTPQPQAHLLVQSFHSDTITGLDVAVRKPVVATTSSDCSIRIWNYEDHKLESSKVFQDEILSVALHPSGHLLLAGFGDKLRLMNLLVNDIRPIHAFSIRECGECRFSRGGHLFAAAQGAVVQLYSTYTFEHVGNLKGHNGRVRSIFWSADDARLLTCGIDGAVYEWDVATRTRISENVLKSCSYTSAVFASDGDAIYAVGSDKTIKELRGGEVSLEAPAGDDVVADAVLTQLAVAGNGTMVFAATGHGTVRSFQYPLTNPAEWASVPAHHGNITRLCIDRLGQQLFSAGQDGTLFIYTITDKEGRHSQAKPVEWADEVLITGVDLTDKEQLVQDLQRRVDELQMASEYQLRLKDMNHNEKLKEMTDKFVQEKEELKRQLQQLKAEREKDLARHEEETTAGIDSHISEIQELEQHHNKRLMAEYEKYQELQAASQAMQERYEEQLQRMEEAKEQALHDLTESWENKLKRQTRQLDTANSTASEQQREAEEMIRQIEIDADQEILRMKLRYEKQLKEEKETSGRLKVRRVWLYCGCTLFIKQRPRTVVLGSDEKRRCVYCRAVVFFFSFFKVSFCPCALVASWQLPLLLRWLLLLSHRPWQCCVAAL